jgi:geranylgeranyl diphosphate synthase, type II
MTQTKRRLEGHDGEQGGRSLVTFEAYLEARRKDVETALETWLPRPPKVPAVVSEAMRYSLFAGGKRLRPMLVIAAAEGTAEVMGTSEAAARDAALPAACAIEMIHTYSLIHDDLPAMDDDDLRRGRPTSHVVNGQGMAILAGDGLQAEAFALLAHEPQGWHATLVTRKLRAIAAIADAAGAGGMVGGQAIDLAAVKPGPYHPPPRIDAEGLQAMHMRKTGALIRASVAAGAIMAGANDRVLAALDTYATEIGLAFQIVDDILDEEGSAGSLGKTAGKDRAAGKPTYPAFYGLERSRELAAACHANANRALELAGLLDSRLGGIAAWIIARRS